MLQYYKERIDKKIKDIYTLMLSVESKNLLSVDTEESVKIYVRKQKSGKSS